MLAGERGVGALRRRQGVGGDSEASAVYSGLFAAGLFAELTSNETNAAAEKVTARRRPMLQLLEFRLCYSFSSSASFITDRASEVTGPGPAYGLKYGLWSMVCGP